MKQLVFTGIFTLLAALSPASEVERLLGEYRPLRSVTCQIRRTVEGPAGPVRFLSRVYWQNDDRLHVENLEPLPRRIIADGQQFYSYAEGDPKGFSRPVTNLTADMLISLRKVPGTAMDHLLRLQGAPEIVLPTENGTLRIGCAAPQRYAELAFDAEKRLVSIEFYQDATKARRTAVYRYTAFEQAAPGVWIPLRHEAEITMANGKTFKETVQIDRLSANTPVAASLFVPASFFDKGVDFADSFGKIYGE